MPTEEKHEIKMMYAVFVDGREEPIVIDAIKDLSLEEAELILKEHNFVKVTRCKDCKYYKIGSDDMHYCFMNDSDHLWQDDDYCSYGKRRTE